MPRNRSWFSLTIYLHYTYNSSKLNIRATKRDKNTLFSYASNGMLYVFEEMRPPVLAHKASARLFKPVECRLRADNEADEWLRCAKP